MVGYNFHCISLLSAHALLPAACVAHRMVPLRSAHSIVAHSETPPGVCVCVCVCVCPYRCT